MHHHQSTRGEAEKRREFLLLLARQHNSGSRTHSTAADIRADQLSFSVPACPFILFWFGVWWWVSVFSVFSVLLSVLSSLFSRFSVFPLLLSPYRPVLTVSVCTAAAAAAIGAVQFTTVFLLLGTTTSTEESCVQ